MLDTREQKTTAVAAQHTWGTPTWLLWVRIGLLTLMLIAAGATQIMGTRGTPGFPNMFGPLAVFFLLTAVSGWYLRAHGWGKIFLYVQLVVDWALVTTIIFYTGGPLSPFLFLYLPFVMSVAALVSRLAGLSASAGVLFLYGGLSYILANTRFGSSDEMAVKMPELGMELQFLALISGMVLVTVLTDYLLRLTRTRLHLIEAQRAALSALSQQQQATIDGLSDGIISTDLNETVFAANPSACKLLGISEKDVLGSTLAELLEGLDKDFAAEGLLHDRDFDLREFRVKAGTDQEQRIVFQSRPISHDQQHTGWLFVFQDVTKLRSIEEQLALQERMARLLAEREIPGLVTSTKLKEFVGESPVMQKVFALIERVAPSEATILVNGESGTGKELVAKAIHLGSPRAGGPFVAVNCGAIPETLIESELFGHKRGSFTGAESDHIGLFRKADGGTLFLDEIGELPLQMQTKLLRTIQERVVRPVGGDRDNPVNVRIIAATNRNLRKETEENRFREDLYYRLNVINISLPSLRSRKEDVPILVKSLLKGLVTNKELPVVSPAALQLLVRYDYPGNVRELENILERATVLGNDVILPEHLPETLQNQATVRKDGGASTASGLVRQETMVISADEVHLPISLDQLLADIERRYLEQALSQSQGVKKRAAELLGMNFRSFRYRLQKFGISDERLE